MRYSLMSRDARAASACRDHARGVQGGRDHRRSGRPSTVGGVVMRSRARTRRPRSSAARAARPRRRLRRRRRAAAEPRREHPQHARRAARRRPTTNSRPRGARARRAPLARGRPRRPRRRRSSGRRRWRSRSKRWGCDDGGRVAEPPRDDALPARHHCRRVAPVVLEPCVQEARKNHPPARAPAARAADHHKEIARERGDRAVRVRRQHERGALPTGSRGRRASGMKALQAPLPRVLRPLSKRAPPARDRARGGRDPEIRVLHRRLRPRRPPRAAARRVLAHGGEAAGRNRSGRRSSKAPPPSLPPPFSGKYHVADIDEHDAGCPS